MLPKLPKRTGGQEEETAIKAARGRCAGRDFVAWELLAFGFTPSAGYCHACFRSITEAHGSFGGLPSPGAQLQFRSDAISCSSYYTAPK